MVKSINKIKEFFVSNNYIDLLAQELKNYDQTLKIKEIPIRYFEFEERVRLLCFHCARYNVNHTCPPKIKDIDYKKMLKEYKHCAVVYCDIPFSKDEYEEVRYKSSVLVHKALLHLEDILHEKNIPMCISFIGGSCKLCKNGCAPDRCRNPYQARIPVEATGINLVKSLKKIGIEIKFPVVDLMHRYGLIFW